ncbi:MAG: TrmH family RNA methyltransferase [Spirochaetaceae bacterium]|nr:TrmH family RNA methyltransferase [Myxococcales bacterium]MCB9724986.1 TrmH family RNA methyltransferase [Spirochaetaceae bacterium]HPG25501.1 TrmH family RNA methyltransferase [Myxococcota bacterium]
MRRRRRLESLAALRAALDRDERIAVVLRREGEIGVEAAALLERARASGARVHVESARAMQRMTGDADAPELLALQTGPAAGSVEALMAEGGLVLGLVGLRYPGNVGFVLRAVETAGAAGVVLANDWAEAPYEEALRLSMHAERYLPVLRAPAAELLRHAREAGRRLIALETSGDRTPWEVDWTAPCVLLVGSEAEGLPRVVLDAADEVVRVPMAGFIPSYNVQAAVGVALGEWMRQTPGAAG